MNLYKNKGERLIELRLKRVLMSVGVNVCVSVMRVG